MGRIIAFLVGLVTVIAAYFGIQYLVPAGTDQQNVTIRLKWAHQAQFAGFYAADHNGLFGTKVTLAPGGSDFPAIKMVVSGNEQFGVTGADQILLARSNNVPVVPLAIIFRDNPFVLFSHRMKTLKGLSDFKGLRVGVKIGGNEELIYRAMMKAANVDTKELIEVPIKFDMTPFMTGQIDVWPGYSINEPIVAESKGVAVDIFKPSAVGVKLYADTLFTTEELVRNNPELVKKVLRGTIEGWQYALLHQEDAATMSAQRAPQSGLDHQRKMMAAAAPLVDPDNTGVGYMTKGGWEETQDVLMRGGFLKQKVDIDRMLSIATQAGAIVK